MFHGGIEASEHDNKTLFVQKNQIPKVFATHPLNMQRSICPASLWLVHHSRPWFLGVIEPSEHDGKTRFVQKNHFPKLSTTHPLNLQRSIYSGSLWLVHPSRACFIMVIEPCEHMVRLALSRKIKLQSCLPLTPWTYKGWFDLISIIATCTSLKSMFTHC